MRPCVAVAPVPSRRSVIEKGADGGAGVLDGELSPPPPHEAAVITIATTSAMRTGTVSSVRERVASAIQWMFAPTTAKTITAGVRLISASIRIDRKSVV